MKYSEAFRSRAIFIETDGLYDIYGRIEGEGSRYILMKDALMGDGSGRVFRVHGVAINKDRIKKAKSMEKEGFLGMMLERYEGYAFRHIIAYILFGMGAFSFGMLIGKLLSYMV